MRGCVDRLDASTLINLINSEVLSFVFRIPNVKFFVGSYVEGECFNKTQADLISNAINEGALHLASE